MTKIAVMIDGGYVRVLAKNAGRVYNPPFIDAFARKCKATSEEIHRILYYDCAPFNGRKSLPVSGNPHTFLGDDAWLNELARKDLFAVRRGVLKFRGWTPRNIPIAGHQLTDADFKADFEQKGVDMRIGLDMANYAANRAIELIALVSNDTDCIPAMKYARRAGLQVALIVVPGGAPAPELLAHCDYQRAVTWP